MLGQEKSRKRKASPPESNFFAYLEQHFIQEPNTYNLFMSSWMKFMGNDISKEDLIQNAHEILAKYPYIINRLTTSFEEIYEAALQAPPEKKVLTVPANFGASTLSIGFGQNLPHHPGSNTPSSSNDQSKEEINFGHPIQ